MKNTTQEIENKRFIAAAVCPACNATDTVFTYLQGGEQWRGCAVCGMRESFSAFAATQEELATRVNQHRFGEPALAHETPTEAVVLVDMPKPVAGSNQVSKKDS